MSMPGPIELAVAAEIEQRLVAIERQEQVRVLYACRRFED